MDSPRWTAFSARKADIKTQIGLFNNQLEIWLIKWNIKVKYSRIPFFIQQYTAYVLKNSGLRDEKSKRWEFHNWIKMWVGYDEISIYKFELLLSIY